MPLSLFSAANSLIYHASGGDGSTIQATFLTPTQPKTNSMQINGQFETYTVDRYLGSTLQYTSSARTASTFVDSSANTDYIFSTPALLDNTLYKYVITPTYLGVLQKPARPKGGSGGGLVCTLASISGLTLSYNGAGSSKTSVSFTSAGTNNTYKSIIIQDPSGTVLSSHNYPNGTFTTSTFTGSSLAINSLYTFKVYVLNNAGIGNNNSACLATIQTCTYATIAAPTFSDVSYASLTVTASGSYNSANIYITGPATALNNNTTSPIGYETPANGSNGLYSLLSSAGVKYSGLNINSTLTFTLTPVNKLNYPNNTDTSSNSIALLTAAVVNNFPKISGFNVNTPPLGFKQFDITNITGIYTGFYYQVSQNGVPTNILYTSIPTILTGNSFVDSNFGNYANNTNYFIKIFPVFGYNNNFIEGTGSTNFASGTYKTITDPAESGFSITSSTSTSTNKTFFATNNTIVFNGTFINKNFTTLYCYLNGQAGASVGYNSSITPFVMSCVNGPGGTGKLSADTLYTADFYVESKISLQYVTTLTVYSAPSLGVVTNSNSGPTFITIKVTGTYTTAKMDWTNTKSLGNEHYPSGSIFNKLDLSNGLVFDGLTPSSTYNYTITTYNGDGLPYYITQTATVPTTTTGSYGPATITASGTFRSTTTVFKTIYISYSYSTIKTYTGFILNRYLGTSITGTLQTSRYILISDISNNVDPSNNNFRIYTDPDILYDNGTYCYSTQAYYTDNYNGITSYATTANTTSFTCSTLANPVLLNPIDISYSMCTTTSVYFTWSNTSTNGNVYTNIYIQNKTLASGTRTTLGSTITYYNSNAIDTLTVNTKYKYVLNVVNYNGNFWDVSSCQAFKDTCTFGDMNTPSLTLVDVSNVTLTATGTSTDSYTTAIVNITPTTGNENPASGSSVTYTALTAGQRYTGLLPGGNITFTIIPVNQLGQYWSTASNVKTSTQQLVAFDVSYAIFVRPTIAGTITISNIAGKFNRYDVSCNGATIFTDLTASTFTHTGLINNTQYNYTIIPAYRVGTAYYTGTPYKPLIPTLPTLPTGAAGAAGTFYTLATNNFYVDPSANNAATGIGTVSFKWMNQNYYKICIQNTTVGGVLTTYTRASNTTLYTSTEVNKLYTNTYYNYAITTINYNGFGLDLSACQTVYRACTWGLINAQLAASGNFTNKTVSSISLTAGGIYTSAKVNFVYTSPAVFNGTESVTVNGVNLPYNQTNGIDISSNDLSNNFCNFYNLSPGTLTYNIAPINQAGYLGTLVTFSAIALTTIDVSFASFDVPTAAGTVSISNITGNNFNQFIVKRYSGAGTAVGKLDNTSTTQSGVSTYSETSLPVNTLYTYTISPYYNVGTYASPVGTIFTSINAPTGAQNTTLGYIYTLPSISGITPVFNNGGSTNSVTFTFTKLGVAPITAYYLAIQNSTLRGDTYIAGNTFITAASASSFTSGSLVTLGDPLLTPNTSYVFNLKALNYYKMGTDDSICRTTITTYTWGKIDGIMPRDISYNTMTFDVSGNFDKLYYTYTPTTGTPGSGTTTNSITNTFPFSQQFTNLTAGTGYIFNFYPVNINNFTSTTVTTSATIYTPPATPSAPTVTLTAGTDISVNWTAVTPAPSLGYTIINIEGWLATKTVTQNVLTTTFTSLGNGSPYTFVVAAQNVAGYSLVSPASTTVTVPATPSKPTVTLSKDVITVSWTTIATARTYTVTNVQGTLTTQSGLISTATSTTFTAVPNGSYTFTLTAVNTVGASNASPVSSSVTVIANSPYVELNFENDITNSGTKAITISRTNDTYNQSFVTGRVGTYAIYFDNAYTNLPGNNVGQNSAKTYITLSVPSLGPPFTFAMWMNIKSNQFYSTPQNSNNTCMEFYQSGASSGSSISCLYKSDVFNLRTNNNSISFNPTMPALGTWVHIAAVVTSATSITTYYNGAFATTGTQDNAGNQLSNSATTMTFNLGWAPFQGTALGYPSLDGYIDQFLIYNKGLTATQIASIYNGGSTTL